MHLRCAEFFALKLKPIRCLVTPVRLVALCKYDVEKA